MIRMRGFTLIELMIVVAILGIIAAVALPSYQGQVRDGRRADSTAVLLQTRQLMERHYSKTYDYGTPAAVGIPAKSPIDGTASYYVITLVAGATTFTLTATPQGAQAADDCGVLTINQAGVKTAGDGTDAAVDACWR